MSGTATNTIELFQIELTNHCNLGCTFCPHSQMKRPQGFMDVDLAGRLLSQVAESGLTSRVGLSYFGESCLHPELLPIIETAGSLGLEPWLCTNGLLLDARRRRKLLDSSLYKLEISLQTPSAHTFNYRRARGTNGFDRYLQQIEDLVREKYRGRHEQPEIEIKLLYTGDSPFKGHRVIDSLDEICLHARHWRRVALEAGADEGEGNDAFEERLARFPRNYRPGDYDSPGNRIEVAPGLCIFACPFIYWGTWIFENQLQMNVAPCAEPSCQELEQHLIVLWDGRATCCCVDYEGELAYANAASMPLAEIWENRHQLYEGKRREAGGNAPDKCRACRGRVKLDWAALRAVDAGAVTRMTCSPRGLQNFSRRAIRKLRS